VQGIECLAKLHDVDAMLAKSWSNWRRGVGLSSSNLQLDEGLDFFCHENLLE